MLLKKCRFYYGLVNNSTGLSELSVYLAIITPDKIHLQICGVEVDCDFILNSLPDFPDYPAHVPAGTSKNVSVTFAPLITGFQEDYLYILNNSPEQNFFVPLRGNGVSSVAEPTTLLLLGFGLVGLVGYGRRKFGRT